jgi:menaquinone-dependent protoporphyrinogen oxidase
MTTLIVYGSRHGTTAEIAERIKGILESKGISTEALPLDKVTDFNKYSVVIVGSAIHTFEWLPESRSFLHTNASKLLNIPTWAFSVGCPGGAPKRWDMTREEEETMIRGHIESDIKIKDHALFYGRFFKSHFTLTWRLVWSVMGGKYGDFTKMDEVDAWGKKVADAILALNL